ncbi:DNA repair protein RecN [Schleiferia thermophila]|jgi:DNA repair protein RecN (Recombination protein N)|uniref:DNA repair protein RecN n=1 Tax=Schleiferia thermophila TaxID=884107 RepID=A0A369AD81_9FLAO|nr:DNA repair protein RecN [Schleiferia thermophila]KFD39960.1 DNA repair protein RecN [Schleiferia thermophila str. Yellowstone]RCX05384.1 DNA replication and repair protein RecN [Schleiferia thermophila]GCD79109.1 DNA repair protein RecN [Schleiferia thermophila]
MIRHLKIRNLALIDRLSVDFDNGLTILTGETGAGKSMILSALNLISGSRASGDIAGNPSDKCYVEAVFDIKNYGLETFFQEHDLDYDTQIIIRREILPGGKSRAFVQDTPVNLQILKELTAYLIDIHSQHDTLLLTQQNFLLDLIDKFADNELIRETYKNAFLNHKKLLAKLDDLNNTSGSERDHDYKTFLLNELENARLTTGELRQLEEKIKLAENAEEALQRLKSFVSVATADETGIESLLRHAEGDLRHLSRFGDAYHQLYERWKNLIPEVRDIVQTVEDLASEMEVDPIQLAIMRERYDQLMHLCHKHKVNDADQLLEIAAQLKAETEAYTNKETIRKELQEKIAEASLQLESTAQRVSESRKSIIPKLESEISNILQQLNFASAVFQIRLDKAPISATGSDHAEMYFAPNPGLPPALVRQIASGGELSRLMLAVKSVLAQKKSLPTLLFDEIDTGVSGASAEKIAILLRSLGSDIQVIAITHLAQIAAAAHHHFLVYKEDEGGRFQTKLKKLNQEAHLQEIARLLSGSTITDSALMNARSMVENYQ